MTDMTMAEPTRRDILYIATTAMGVVGAASVIWPLVNQMNPDLATLALSKTEIDLKPVASGQNIVVKWQGKPVFVRNRPPKMVEQVRAVPLAQLIDPETDQARVQVANWLIVVGVCTHLGCTPNAGGDYDGWLCPCHGSEYDASGRVRRGPAPLNLLVPKYVFKTPTSVVVG